MAQSLNRYAYVGDDPVNRVDPLGLVTNCTPYQLWNCGPIDDDPSSNEGGGVFWDLRRIPWLTEFEARGGQRGSDFGKEFQKAEKMILDQDCVDFLLRVIHAATLAAAEQPDPSKLGPGEQDVYNTTPEGVLDASENASLIEQPKVDPTEGGFRTAATSYYWNQSITLYSAFYEQGTTSRAQIFLHEGLHLIFPFSDAQLAAAAGVPAGPNQSASNNFQQQLKEHCK